VVDLARSGAWRVGLLELTQPNHLVVSVLRKAGGRMPLLTLRMTLLGHGTSVAILKETLEFMQNAGAVDLDDVGGEVIVSLRSME